MIVVVLSPPELYIFLICMERIIKRLSHFIICFSPWINAEYDALVELLKINKPGLLNSSVSSMH